MRRFSLIALFIMFICLSSSNAGAENSPEDILATAFANYNLIASEIEYSKIRTTNWEDVEKFCTSWISRKADGRNEMMFLLNRDEDLRPKADGAVINSINGTFDPPVIFQKRRSVKYKNSGYDEFSNGTELNYFDLMRLGGESVNSLELSFWVGQPDKQIKYPNEKCSDCEIKFSIKAIPRAPQKGDYAFRVFHVGIVHEMLVVLAVEFFDEDLSLAKLQFNSGFEVVDSITSRVFRERQRTFITNQGTTVITVVGHKVDVEFGKLDEDTLKKGQP